MPPARSVGVAPNFELLERITAELNDGAASEDRVNHKWLARVLRAGAQRLGQEA